MYKRLSSSSSPPPPPPYASPPSVAASECGSSGSLAPATPSHATLVTTGDLLRGRVVWGRGRTADWWFYMKNQHSLLSMCLAHRKHPYSRCTRAAVLLSALAFSFMLASVMALKLGCNQCIADDCHTCFEDYYIAESLNVTASLHSKWLMASVRWYVRGPCEWCGNATLADGGCFNRNDLADLYNGFPTRCPVANTIDADHKGFEDQCAAAEPLHDDQPPFKQKCAERQAAIVWTSVTFVAVIVLMYSRLLRSVGYCKCAYKGREKRRRHWLAFCCCHTTSRVIIFFCTLLGAGFALLGVLCIFAARRDANVAVRSFILNKLAAWVLSIVWLTLVFTIKRWWQLYTNAFSDTANKGVSFSPATPLGPASQQSPSYGAFGSSHSSSMALEHVSGEGEGEGDAAIP